MKSSPKRSALSCRLDPACQRQVVGPAARLDAHGDGALSAEVRGEAFAHRTKLPEALKSERSQRHGGVQRALGERVLDLSTKRTEAARDLDIGYVGIEESRLQVQIGELQGPRRDRTHRFLD